MRKALGVLLLSGAAALFTFSAPDSFAQKKGKTAKASGGTIELIKSRDGKYRFSVRNSEGKYVGGSAVGHPTEKDAKEAAETLKSVIATATYVSKQSSGAKSKSKD